jgi:hypothetical protein
MEVRFIEAGYILYSSDTITIAPEQEDRFWLNNKLYIVQDRCFKIEKKNPILEIYLEFIG